MGGSNVLGGLDVLGGRDVLGELVAPDGLDPHSDLHVLDGREVLVSKCSS